MYNDASQDGSIDIPVKEYCYFLFISFILSKQ